MVVFRDPERSDLDARAFEFCLCGEIADLVHAGNAEKKEEAQRRRACGEAALNKDGPVCRNLGFMKEACGFAQYLCASSFFSAFPA
ncbi:MAG: hypothetical protein U1E37_07990 [Sphingomonadaceae bacterium]